MAKMKRIKRLRTPTEKYTDRQTGAEKQGYSSIGYLLEREDGDLVMKIDTIPVGFSGWIYCGDLETQQTIDRAGITSGQNTAPVPQTPGQYPSGGRPGAQQGRETNYQDGGVPEGQQGTYDQEIPF
jgi:hypothetical protein